MSSESLNILKRQKAEIELLSGRIDTINDTNKILIDSQEIYWKNRVKEFAERLKEKNDNPGKAMFDVYEYYGETIDSLVKEMTEEKE